MRVWSEFDSSSGMFTGRVIRTTSKAALARGPGYSLLEGKFDRLSQRLDLESGQVVDYQPPSPGEEYEWISEDAQGNRVRRWVKKREVIEREAAEAAAHAKIAELERSQPRAIRELILAMSTVEDPQQGGAVEKAEIVEAARQRVAAIDTQIAAQRAIINQSRSPATEGGSR